MPVHDWSKAYAGHFHHFHQRWSGEICDALNDGLLPDGLFALVEQKGIGVEPDVMALSKPGARRPPQEPRGGIAVHDTPPRVTHVRHKTDAQSYAARANRIGVRTIGGGLTAVVEIVSPGNKDRKHSIRSLIDKTLDFLARGVHVLVVDPLQPTPRDPNGIHRAIWDEIADDDFVPPADRRLTLASYVAAPEYSAYVESATVGGPLPDMPLFIAHGWYVTVPLETSYMRTWEKCPEAFREMVLSPDLLDRSTD